MGKIKPARTTPAQKRNSVVRWIFYFVVIVLCTAFQNAGDYVKPLLLIPVALCIASNVKQGAAVFIGILCGFLLDFSCNRLALYAISATACLESADSNRCRQCAFRDTGFSLLLCHLGI